MRLGSCGQFGRWFSNYDAFIAYDRISKLEPQTTSDCLKGAGISPLLWGSPDHAWENLRFSNRFTGVVWDP
eukprot:6430600-Amphidinium_carterae.1